MRISPPDANLVILALVLTLSLAAVFVGVMMVISIITTFGWWTGAAMLLFLLVWFIIYLLVRWADAHSRTSR